MMMRSEYLPPPPSLPMPAARADPSKQLVIAELLKEPGNETCADCDAVITMENTWAVMSYGILVCDDCKLVHIELQNHYKMPEGSVPGDATTHGMLSTQLPHVWEDKDIAKIRANGNQKSNANFLKKVHAWQYRPQPTDGIKLKEYWIKWKYCGSGDGPENPANVTKKPFLGFQFIRPMPKGESYHCCAVLQNDVMYLTSDNRNEEIPIEHIETVMVNSKRIGHDNGVQLTYRLNGDANTAAYTYLQHESMETVMTWLNLLLYTKYNLLKRKYPTMIEQNISKILNFNVVKESYTYLPRKGLVYFSLSEARLSCFQHHLDDTPLFQIAVSEALNLDANQYLDAVACFFDVDVSKIASYGDWNNAVEQVLQTDKIGSLPDDTPKPTFPFSLLKKPEKTSVPEKTPELPAAREIAPMTVTSTASIDSVSPSPPATKSDNEKENEKKPSNYECYPPIGPMGEMGKVYRGELPADALKPPTKTDVTRLGLYGEFNPQMAAAHIPLSVKSSYNDLMANPALTSFTNLNSANTTLFSHALTKENANCYPPIGGPAKIRYDLPTLTALQAAHMRREQEALSLEELRGAPASVVQNTLLRSSLGQKPSLFDQARLPHMVNHIGRFPDGDTAALAAASGFGQSQYAGWGDGPTENILTVPWKSTGSGYEPARNFPTTNSQFAELWGGSAKMQEKPFGAWGSRSATDLAQHAMLGRSQSSNWGAGIGTVGLEHWPTKNSVSPIDSFPPRDHRSSTSSILSSSSKASSGLMMNDVVRTPSDSSPGISSQQSTILDTLAQHWQNAEQRLMTLIHNAYIPASDMAPAGLNKDSADHAYTCISELFDLLWKRKYDLALSFLRGFREVFSNSVHPEIRNLFIGQGELDTMKRVFLEHGKEKFFGGTSGGPINWKQSTTPPSTTSDAIWPNSKSLGNSDSSRFFWGSSQDQGNSLDLWAGTAASRSASVSSDPWNTGSSAFSGSSSLVGATHFNRAPSRPSQSQSSIGNGKTSPLDGPFSGIKGSPDRITPRGFSPPTSFEPLTSNPALNGLENTLKNLLMSDNN